jgi:uncharacterized membrane protein YeaQ/YmgE (transglycosylase-associated protein family)
LTAAASCALFTKKPWAWCCRARPLEQAASTEVIDKKDLQPGDLVFFNTMRRAFSHVGIYVGDGKFIHCPAQAVKCAWKTCAAAGTHGRHGHACIPLCGQPARKTLARCAHQRRLTRTCRKAALRLSLFLKGRSMLSVIGSLLIGLVVGFIARALKPGDDKLGWIMTALLGVAGSFVASYAGQALGWYGPGEAAGFIASVVGAIVLLVVYGLVKGKG